MQFYSDPSREQEPTSLPDCETLDYSGTSTDNPYVPEGGPGWYWWISLSDNDANGPFETEALAIADARTATIGGAS